MTRSRLFALILTLTALLLAGCSRDPNVRKQKYFASGQSYFDQGKYAEAAIQFSNAADIDPRFTEAHYRLAQSLLKLNQWQHAYQELTRTVELQPDNYPAHIDLANLFISGHDLKKAQEQIDLLQSKQPENPLVHLAVANLLAAQQNLPGAIQETQKAITLAPDRAQSYLSLGLLQMQANQPQDGEANLKKAIALNPNTADARMALGGYYASQKRLAEAEQQFRQAMQSEPKNPAPRAAIAHLYILEGKKAETEEFLKQTKHDLAGDSAGYRMLGDFYFASGDLDRATDEYAALAHDHPEDRQVIKNYTQLLILKDRLPEARRFDDEILKSFPNDSDALICRAQIQIREGHPGDAVPTLRTVIKNDPDNALAHYHLGAAFDQLDQLQQAQSEWQRAVQLRPDLSDAQVALANLALRQGDMALLEQRANEMIRLQPGAAQGYVFRSLSFIRRGQFNSAEQDARKAISLAPQNAAGYIQMGNLKLAQKQYGDAEKAYQQALNLDPASLEALAGLMNTCLADKQVDKAVAAANAQIAKSPNNSGFYDLLGTVLFNNKKDLAGAEAALTKSVALDKNDSDAVVKLGQLQVAKGSAGDAIATYQQALKDNPHQVTFSILLGELYDLQHDFTKSKEAYQKALEIEPNNSLAANNLAYLLLQNGGNVDEAVSLAQTARRSTPDSPGPADTLGWAFYQKGYYGQSIDLFEEALRLAGKSNGPDNPTVHYHLGLAYEKNGQTAQARKELQRVLQINPKYSNADDVKKLLAQLPS